MEDEAFLAAALDDMDKEKADELMQQWLLDKMMVTSKKLSAQMKIPLKVAREHIDRYYCNFERRERMNIWAVYYVSGRSERKGVMIYKTGLVREQNLDEARRRLDRVVSCHIYSIQVADIKGIAGPLMADTKEERTRKNKNPYVDVPIRCANAKRRHIETAEDDDVLLASNPSLSTSTGVSKYFDKDSTDSTTSTTISSKPILEPAKQKDSTAKSIAGTSSTISKKSTATSASSTISKKSESIFTKKTEATASKKMESTSTVSKKTIETKKSTSTIVEKPKPSTSTKAQESSKKSSESAGAKKRSSDGKGGGTEPKKQCKIDSFFKRN